MITFQEENPNCMQITCTHNSNSNTYINPNSFEDLLIVPNDILPLVFFFLKLSFFILELSFLFQL